MADRDSRTPRTRRAAPLDLPPVSPAAGQVPAGDLPIIGGCRHPLPRSARIIATRTARLHSRVLAPLRSRSAKVRSRQPVMSIRPTHARQARPPALAKHRLPPRTLQAAITGMVLRAYCRCSVLRMPRPAHDADIPPKRRSGARSPYPGTPLSITAGQGNSVRATFQEHGSSADTFRLFPGQSACPLRFASNDRVQPANT